MKVMKFGGTSVGKPQRMQQVASLVTKDDERKIVVLSALSGTTNALVEISESLVSIISILFWNYYRKLKQERKQMWF